MKKPTKTPARPVQVVIKRPGPDLFLSPREAMHRGYLQGIQHGRAQGMARAMRGPKNRGR